MMKISKPLMIDNFSLSTVHFTSLNSIIFKNVKSIYFGNEKIYLEYEYQSKVHPSSRDWIGIFPRGWSSLQQYVTFEWVSQDYAKDNLERCSSDKENEGDIHNKTIVFLPVYHCHNVRQHSTYQFVYVSKQIEVLGVSSYFKFDLSKRESPDLEFIVPVSASLKTSTTEFGNILAESSISRVLEPSPVLSRQSVAANDKLHISLPNSTSGLSDSNKFMGRNAFCSHSEPLVSVPMGHCKKCFQCKRNTYFLRSQEILQSKLKIVMERNKTLEERAQEMKKEQEKYQVENKRLKMTYYTLNKEKVAYEKFVKDFIKSLEKDSIVRVMNGNTEILVKKINYVGMEEHPRDKKTSKRERELKAVIGLQEITIRNLITNLQEKAKSVEEIKNTVKLAKEFAEITKEDADSEHSSDQEDVIEINSSDVHSEYDFVLKRPEPPEGIAPTTEVVLEDIKRTTEMELKDIGIDRKLADISPKSSEAEINVPRLEVQSEYMSRLKKLHRIDQIQSEQEFWSVENNTQWQSTPRIESIKETPNKIKRKVSQIKILPEENRPCPTIKSEGSKEAEEEAKLVEHTEMDSVVKEEQTEFSCETEKKICSKEPCVDKDIVSVEEEINMIESEVKEEPKVEGIVLDEISSCCTEDFFDAADVSARSAQISSLDISQQKLLEERKTIVRSKSLESINEEYKNLVLRNCNSMSQTEEWVNSLGTKESSRTNVDSVKGKKFTCQLSIDLNPSKTETRSDKCESSLVDKKEKPVYTLSSDEGKEKTFSLKEDNSLVTFKRSDKHVEIKITRVASDENFNKKSRSFHQKMIFKFGTGNCLKICEPKLLLDVNEKTEKDDHLSETENDSNGDDIGKTICDEHKKETDPKDDGIIERKEDELSGKSLEENVTISSTSEWIDAKEDSIKASCCEEKTENSSNEALQEETTKDLVVENQMKELLAAKKVRFEHQDNCRKLKYFDMLNDDSINNLRIYQESMRLEKNMEYFQNRDRKELIIRSDDTVIQQSEEMKSGA